MKKIILILLLLGNLYSEEACLGVDFRSHYPPLKLDSEHHYWAKAQMTTFAKEFGLGVCIRYFEISPKKAIMAMQIFDNIFRQIDSVGNAISPRCYTSNNAKKIKEDIKNYVISQNKNRLLVPCLYMYNSPEYQTEIEKIVKKYCENCK